MTQGISKKPWLSSLELKYKNSRRTLINVLKSCGKQQNMPIYGSRSLELSNCHLDAAHILNLMHILVQGI